MLLIPLASVIVIVDATVVVRNPYAVVDISISEEVRYDSLPAKFGAPLDGDLSPAPTPTPTPGDEDGADDSDSDLDPGEDDREEGSGKGAVRYRRHRANLFLPPRGDVDPFLCEGGTLERRRDGNWSGGFFSGDYDSGDGGAETGGATEVVIPEGERTSGPRGLRRIDDGGPTAATRVGLLLPSGIEGRAERGEDGEDPLGRHRRRRNSNDGEVEAGEVVVIEAKLVKELMDNMTATMTTATTTTETIMAETTTTITPTAMATATTLLSESIFQQEEGEEEEKEGPAPLDIALLVRRGRCTFEEKARIAMAENVRLGELALRAWMEDEETRGGGRRSMGGGERALEGNNLTDTGSEVDSEGTAESTLTSTSNLTSGSGLDSYSSTAPTDAVSISFESGNGSNGYGDGLGGGVPAIGPDPDSSFGNSFPDALPPMERPQLLRIRYLIVYDNKRGPLIRMSMGSKDGDGENPPPPIDLSLVSLGYQSGRDLNNRMEEWSRRDDVDHGAGPYLGPRDLLPNGGGLPVPRKGAWFYPVEIDGVAPGQNSSNGGRADPGTPYGVVAETGDRPVPPWAAATGMARGCSIIGFGTYSSLSSS